MGTTNTALVPRGATAAVAEAAGARLPAYVTREQARAVIAAAHLHARPAAVRVPVADRGRVTEVLRLRRGDVDAREGALRLANLKQRRRALREKLVYVSPELLRDLVLYAKDLRLGPELPEGLRELPPVLALHPAQQASQVAARPRPLLRAGEAAGAAGVQRRQARWPLGHGDRTRAQHPARPWRSSLHSGRTGWRQVSRSVAVGSPQLEAFELRPGAPAVVETFDEADADPERPKVRVGERDGWTYAVEHFTYRGAAPETLSRLTSGGGRPSPCGTRRRLSAGSCTRRTASW